MLLWGLALGIGANTAIFSLVDAKQAVLLLHQPKGRQVGLRIHSRGMYFVNVPVFVGG
jgi:hypothetical protein